MVQTGEHCKEAANALPNHVWRGSVSSATMPEGCIVSAITATQHDVYFNVDTTTWTGPTYTKFEEFSFGDTYTETTATCAVGSAITSATECDAATGTTTFNERYERKANPTTSAYASKSSSACSAATRIMSESVCQAAAEAYGYTGDKWKGPAACAACAPTSGSNGATC